MSAPTQLPANAPEGHTVERHGIRWSIGSEPIARALLKENSHLVQAGFNAESVTRAVISRVPILYSGGDEHRRQRAAVARYFAPKVIDERYRDKMDTEATLAETELLARGHIDLDPIALTYSMTVAATVIGLNYSSIPGMGKRLESFFNSPRLADAPTWLQNRENARGMGRLARFWAMDVRPAIKAHRAEEIDDVMGHLVKDGYSDVDILIECITYAAAGMVTTREFIAKAALVLLEQPELLADYRSGDTDRRYAVLHEILRLNPVVTRVSRRVVEDHDLPTVDAENAEDAGGAGCPVSHGRLSAGESVDIDVYTVNTDPVTAGECPRDYIVGRPLPRLVKPDVLGFGDGAHRCPGAFLAIRETDVLLSRLLRHDLELVSEVDFGIDDMISSYKVRNVRLRLLRQA